MFRLAAMKVYLIQQMRTYFPARFMYADASLAKFEEISVGGVLVEHPKEGLVLVDNGVAAGESLRNFGGRFAAPFLPTLNASVPDQLTAAGINPEDIRHVIFTHLHFDHTGDVSRYTRARLWTSTEELRLAKKRWAPMGSYPPLLHQWEYRIEPLEVWYHTEPELGPFPILKDLFRDKSVVIMFTPGHTAGAVSVLVRDGKKKYFLCGDACYCRRNYRESIDHGRIGLIWADQKQRLARGTRRRLLEWEQHDKGLKIIPAHDIGIWGSSPLFPNPLT